MLDGALTGAGRGTESPRLSLDRLVGAMKEARRSAPLPTGTTTGNDGTLTLSLTDLAKMLKKNPDVGRRTKDAPSSERRAPAHGVPRIPHRHPQTPPPSQQMRRSSRPSHVANPRHKEAQRPLVPAEARGDKLDINLLTNLLRWVGSAKSRLGVQHMEALLGVYRGTGHLTPIVDMLICRAARFELIPDESEHYTHTIDDLAELLLSLHGVVYGSGHAPAGPEVEFDPSMAWGWARAQRAAAAPFTAERAEGLSSGAPAAGIESPTGLTAPVLSRRAPASQNGRPWTFDAADTPSMPPPVKADGTESVNGVQKHARLAGAAPSETSIRTRARPSDVSDEEWQRVEALVPQVKQGGRPGKYERREILNGILYRLRTGCSWHNLDKDLPPWKIVHHYYRTWRHDRSWPLILAGLDRPPSCARALGP